MDASALSVSSVAFMSVPLVNLKMIRQSEDQPCKADSDSIKSLHLQVPSYIFLLSHLLIKCIG